MKSPKPQSTPSSKGDFLPKGKQLLALWPHWPLALFLVLVGLLNVFDGLSLPLALFQRVRAVSGLGESLDAVGGTAQVILGLMIVGAGLGLLRKLSLAWTLAVLLLIITIALSVARSQWGPSLALRMIMLCLLFTVRHHFTRRTVLANLLFSLSNILAIIAYGVLGSYLLRDGFRPPIPNLSTALYFTITTLSTVGFGDFVPNTPQARWFVVSLLVMGLGVFAGTIATAVGPKISSELDRIFNPKEKIMQPKDHVILVGEGSIGLNTAKELSSRGLTFVQIVTTKIESDKSDHIILQGDATSDAILHQAGIERARLIIAAQEDDGENAFISLGAKDLNPKIRVLAVASSARSIRRLKLARADLVFSPAAVGSRLLVDLVQGNQISPEFADLLEGHSPKK